MSTERDELAAIISAHDDYWPDHVAELILAAGYRKPRRVTGDDGLEALLAEHQCDLQSEGGFACWKCGYVKNPAAHQAAVIRAAGWVKGCEEEE